MYRYRHYAYETWYRYKSLKIGGIKHCSRNIDRIPITRIRIQALLFKIQTQIKHCPSSTNPNTALQTSSQIEYHPYQTNPNTALHGIDYWIESNSRLDFIFDFQTIHTSATYPIVLCVPRQAKEEPWSQDCQNNRP